MNILQSTGSAPDYIPPPPLSPDQIVCGPRYPERRRGDRVLSLATATGEWDAAALVARLPAEQRPDLFIVRADSVGENLPRNLAAFGGQKVLVIGDTHHRIHPIIRMLAYARSEPFDAIIFDYTRQHAHYFLEAGLERVYWLPGFNVARIAIDPGRGTEIPIGFVGAVGSLHPRRQALCEALRAAGLPLHLARADHRETRALHARSRISLNCSLNGDLNLRVFEVLASGGFLLTDRLGAEAGLDLLFAEGEHLALYDGIEDCIAQCRAFLADPARARGIAAAGQAAYEAGFAPERIAGDFFALLRDGTVRLEFDLAHDARRRLAPPPGGEALLARIRLYEIMQELHRRHERMALLASPGVDPRLLADLADLPRLDIAVAGESGGPDLAQLLETVRLCGLERRIRVIAPTALEALQPTVIALTAAECAAPRVTAMSARWSRSLLLVTDLAADAATPSALAARGYRRLAATVPLFGRG